MKICVVFGGNGSEAEVSYSSSRFILNAIKNLGFNAVELPFDAEFIDKIRIINPDVVFNAMHGTWGEDGVLPTLLDFLKIPYTHSGRNASIYGMNKEFTKQIAVGLGIPVLPSKVYHKEQILQGKFIPFKSSFLKPVLEGSTIGCVRFTAENGLSAADLEIIKSVKSNFFLLEEFCDGFEVSIGVLGEKSIGGVEIRPKSNYYDYTSKYTKGKTDYFCPPRISPELLLKMEEFTLKLHFIIGAKGVSRADFLVKEDAFYLLEINTHPGFTENSLIPKMGYNKGISAEEIIRFLIQNASFESYEK